MMMESTTAIRKDNDFPNVNINGDSDTRTRIAGAANMAIVNKRAVAFLFFRAERRWCLYWPIWPVFLGGEGKKQLQVDFRCTPRVINERRAIYSTCEHRKIKNFTSWIRCFNDSKDLSGHSVSDPYSIYIRIRIMKVGYIWCRCLFKSYPTPTSNICIRSEFKEKIWKQIWYRQYPSVSDPITPLQATTASRSSRSCTCLSISTTTSAAGTALVCACRDSMLLDLVPHL